VSFAQTLDHAWWLASRSAGIVAYVLLSASVVLGLAMALKLAAPRRTAVLRTVHERIALLALGALAAHGLLLLGDGFLRPGLGGILVPFAMSYRPTWTGIGILAGYLTAGLSLTYYARRHLGARRWRAAHRLIPVAWAMAVVHVIGSGSDAGSLWLQVVLALTMSGVLTLLGYRVLGGRSAHEATPRDRRPAPVAASAVVASDPTTQPMPAVPRPVVTAAADEPVTTVAPPSGYRPLWARDPSAPPQG
jgi:methionine sulfoxide reductase heme-binding subunit